MTLALVTAPSREPVSLEEAKLQLRIDHFDEDQVIEGLIKAARERVESETNRALITQVWDLLGPAFPLDRFEIPKPPLISVTSVSYVDTSGVTQVWSSALYQVLKPVGPWAERATLRPKYGQYWPLTQPDTEGAVTVRFSAGYGPNAADVPAVLRQAVLRLVTAWFDDCEETGGATGILPSSISLLLAPFVNRPVCVG